MKKQYSISIYLDTRRKKGNEKYPVRLRVYANAIGKQKLYSTKFDYTEKEFQSIWLTTKPREKYKQQRLEIQAIENKANSVADSINPFSFEKFERKLYLKSGQGDDVFFQYQSIININKKFGRVGNASNYDLSLKSLKKFLKHKTGREQENLRFIDINASWLNEYENYMLNVEDKSRTTVSIYLRALRSVFNSAIKENEIPSEIYPFGRNKYQIPSVKRVKKALSYDQLKKLFYARPRNREQEKAKDFWFFSYSCSGMNIKDIALLKYDNLKDGKIIYYRAKTINTAKSDLKPITVYLNEYAQSIINKYGKSGLESDEYIFQIVDDQMPIEESYNKIKNFTRFINQNLKKLATEEGLPSDISTYWARHTFSTIAIQNGMSIEFVSEALNHSDLRTTQNYIAGFEDDVKKQFAQNLMKFE